MGPACQGKWVTLYREIFFRLQTALGSSAFILKQIPTNPEHGFVLLRPSLLFKGPTPVPDQAESAPKESMRISGRLVDIAEMVENLKKIKKSTV
jgi:hypothetical protein